VRVDPAGPHRRDPGHERARAFRDLAAEDRIEDARRRLEDVARTRATGGGGDDATVDGDGRLDQGADARRRLGVPHDRFQRGHPTGSRHAGPEGGECRSESLQLDAVAHLRDRAVAFDEVQPGRRVACELVGPADRPRLAVAARRGHPGLAVGRHAPASEHRDDADPRGAGVLEALEHDKPTPLTRQEAVGPAIVDLHVVGSEGPGLGEADQLERIEADVDTAGERQVECPRRQLLRRGDHRQ
jgi:hypothetical protein